MKEINIEIRIKQTAPPNVGEPYSIRGSLDGKKGLTSPKPEGILPADALQT